MNKIIILDIETTGFLNQNGSIVEIGMVELNLDNGEIKTVYDSLLKEDILSARHREKPMGWIFRSSSITVEMIRNAPDAGPVLKEAQNIINKYPVGVTAYNNNFDFSFLESRGIKFMKKLPDPMKLLTDIMKLPNNNGYNNYKWPSVEEAYKYLFPESNYIEKHRGADDAKHEAEIVYKLYEMGVFKI